MSCLLLLLLLPNNLILRLLLRRSALERCLALSSSHGLIQITWLILSTGNVIEELGMRTQTGKLRCRIHLLSIIQFDIVVVHVDTNGYEVRYWILPLSRRLPKIEDGPNIIDMTYKITSRASIRRRYADLWKLLLRLCI